MSSMQRAPELGANGAPAQGDQLQQAATGLLNQAARTADAQASTTMTKVGDGLVAVSQAITEAASSLRESQPQVASFVDTAAVKAEEAATYLQQHDASEVLDTVQQTARRQPLLVVGGGLALGLILGRVLRSGATAAQGGSASGSYEGGSGLGSTYGSTGYGSTAYGSTEAGAYGTEDALDGPDVAIELEVTDEAAVIEDIEGAELGTSDSAAKGRSRRTR